MNHAQMVHLDNGKKIVASKRADREVETGHDGEGLGQEVSVLQEFILRNISKGCEFLLVFGMLLQETEINMKTTVLKRCFI